MGSETSLKHIFSLLGKSPSLCPRYENAFCKCIGIGFKRLSILDVENGSQPFTSPDGRYTAVFNGEIYNFNELQLLIRWALMKYF